MIFPLHAKLIKSRFHGTKHQKLKIWWFLNFLGPGAPYFFILLNQITSNKSRKKSGKILGKIISMEIRESKFSIFLSFRFPQKCFPNFSRDVHWFFLDLIEVFWSNKMKKYGLPGPKKLRNDKKSRFWRLIWWNRHFIKSIWSRKNK